MSHSRTAGTSERQQLMDAKAATGTQTDSDTHKADRQVDHSSAMMGVIVVLARLLDSAWNHAAYLEWWYDYGSATWVHAPTARLCGLAEHGSGSWGIPGTVQGIDAKGSHSNDAGISDSCKQGGPHAHGSPTHNTGCC